MALRLLADYGDENPEDEASDSSTSSASDRNLESAGMNDALRKLSSVTLEMSETIVVSTELSAADPLLEPKQPLGFPQCIELNDEERVTIPEETTTPLDEALERNYAVLLTKQRQTNLDLNREIQNSTAFRNPSIYQKLIEYCQIEEFGTNFPKDQFDPTRWTEKDSVEELARLQGIATEKAEKDKKSGKPQEVQAKRKSKWGNEPPARRVGPLPLPIPASRTSGAANLSKSTR